MAGDMVADGETGAALLALHDRLVAGMDAGRIAELDRLKRLRPRRTGCRGFADLGSETNAALKAAARRGTAVERRDLSRALIAWLATGALSRIRARGVTDDILARSGRWLGVLLAFLETAESDDYVYPGDLFLKDYRFVTALTVPCGAQVVDLNDGIGLKTALRIARRDVGAAIRSFRAPWFRVHTEGRDLGEFNEAGWTACYRRIAELLGRHPDIAGMAATSWFYDPQLGEISPRLAYLRALPMQHGAILVPHGTTAFDIQSATATSASRRELYEQGRYRPVCHSLLWPRGDLLRWARQGH